MRAWVRRFVMEDDGQDLIEYALLSASIALGSIVAINVLGSTMRTFFAGVAITLGS
jgi:Flp pilus assembly pilin Flp